VRKEVASFAQKREFAFAQQATGLRRVIHLSQPKVLAVTIITLTPFSFPEEFTQVLAFAKLFFGVLAV